MKESSLKENHFIQSLSNPALIHQEITTNKENITDSFANPNLMREKEEVKIVNLGVFGNSRKRLPVSDHVNGNPSKTENKEKKELDPEEKKFKLSDV